MSLGHWVTLNVGGTKFSTTRSVLTSDPDSMLAKMFEHEGAMQPAAKDKDGAYLIDGNPEYFKPILQFLRRREIIIDSGVSREGVLLEAKYFGVQSMVAKMEDNGKGCGQESLTDFISLKAEDTKFNTTREVLTRIPGSKLAKMFGSKKAMLKIARDRDGAYLLDTNPDYFKPILQFLRRGEVAIDPGVSLDGVEAEAKFF